MKLLTQNFDKNFIFVIVYWVLEIAVIIVTNQFMKYFKMTTDFVIDQYIALN